jgi:hypothetical protein
MHGAGMMFAENGVNVFHQFGWVHLLRHDFPIHCKRIETNKRCSENKDRDDPVPHFDTPFCRRRDQL